MPPRTTAAPAGHGRPCVVAAGDLERVEIERGRLGVLDPGEVPVGGRLRRDPDEERLVARDAKPDLAGEPRRDVAADVDALGLDRAGLRLVAVRVRVEIAVAVPLPLVGPDSGAAGGERDRAESGCDAGADQQAGVLLLHRCSFHRVPAGSPVQAFRAMEPAGVLRYG